MTADTRASASVAYVFVYGSLMEGFELHSCLADSEFVSAGAVAGRLVALGEYPGLLDGDGVVQGEVYHCPDPDRSLKTIDRIERFDPTNPAGSLFLRVARRVALTDGSELVAWVYVLNQSQTDAQVVPKGDWRAFVAASKASRLT